MAESADCLGCRLVNGICFLGVAAYLGYTSKQVKGYNQIGFLILGGCFGVIGLTRLVGFNPFKKKGVDI